MTAVAIDGPAGAGKSTIARAAAKELGFIYVDTGAMYRAIGYYMLAHGVRPEDTEAVCANLQEVKVDIRFVDGEQHVFLCGEDVSGKIRTGEVSMAASKVSAIPEVRRFLFSMQRGFAEKNNVIMDGRDIGTVVLPDAQVKIFLTASPEERARRRYVEMTEKGMTADYDKVLAEIRERDYNDSHREVAPLIPAKDSILVDTTEIGLDDAIAQLVSVIRGQLGTDGLKA